VPYLLTVLGVTLPAAGAAGLVYRMGRVFELRRPWRCGLAAAVVFGTGLVSYAVVLKPLCAGRISRAGIGGLPGTSGCQRQTLAGRHLADIGRVIRRPGRCHSSTGRHIPGPLPGGHCRHAPASVHRILGVGLYGLGALFPLGLYAALTIPLTGDLLPATMHPELALHRQSRLQQILLSEKSQLSHSRFIG